jgi:signal peptidase I
LAYGIFGYFAYWMQHRSLSGIVILSFFVYGGGIVRKALPREAVESVVAFFVFTLVINCLSPYGVSWVGALCCICPPLLLLGSFRAGNPARAKKEFWWLRAAGRLVLMLLLLSAATVVLFGPVLGLYTTQSYDHSMEPTIHAGDWLVGENASPTRPIVRGELVEVNSWSPRSLRVAGIPGDRIQIKNGRLIRNGVEVPDADRDRYSGSDGDFLRRLKSGRPYTVPDGFYFMLNDNLDQRDDSRTIGPIPQEYIVARVIAAYPRKPIGLELPRLIQ